MTGPIVIEMEHSPEIDFKSKTAGGKGLRVKSSSGQYAQFGTIKETGAWDRYIYIADSDTVEKVDGSLRFVDNTLSKSYIIHGEHSKPKGSYVGNGSETERVIDVGGTGGVVAIYGEYGIGIATPLCGFMMYPINNELEVFAYNQLRFVNNKLYIANNDRKINGNGTIYTYEVL